MPTKDSSVRTLRIRDADWEVIEAAAKRAGMTVHGWCVDVLVVTARGEK